MFGILHIAVTTLMVGFMFAETFMISSGQGFSISEGGQKANFNSIRQVEVVKFESSTSCLEATSLWNIQVHYYLKYYVSMRLKDRTLPRGAI